MKRLAAFRKEDPVVTDFAGRGHPLTQGQLSPQHFQRTRAEIDLAILVGLGPILFSRQDQSFGDVDRAVNQVAITDLQRKLLRLSQAGEEPELFVVPVPFAVNAMRSGNDRFSIRHGERVYCRAIFLGDSKRREREVRIKLSRKILVPELDTSRRMPSCSCSRSHRRALARSTWPASASDVVPPRAAKLATICSPTKPYAVGRAEDERLKLRPKPRAKAGRTAVTSLRTERAMVPARFSRTAAGASSTAKPTIADVCCRARAAKSSKSRPDCQSP